MPAKQEENKATAKVAPKVTLEIAGFGSMDLARETATVKLNKRTAALLKRETATVTTWHTLTEKVTEVAWEDDETGEEILSAIVTPRHSVTVDVPEGVTFGTVTVSAFGESRDIALETFARTARAEKRDGKATGRMIARPPVFYGATEYVRPTGARFVYAVKVTPSADGKRARIGAIVAQP